MRKNLPKALRRQKCSTIYIVAVLMQLASFILNHIHISLSLKFFSPLSSIPKLIMASSSTSSSPPVLSHPNISTLISHSGIPVRDLSKSYSKQLIVRACEEFCFFKIINHGMEFITMLESEAVKSFSLPLSEKEKAGHANTLGYGNKNIGIFFELIKMSCLFLVFLNCSCALNDYISWQINSTILNFQFIYSLCLSNFWWYQISIRPARFFFLIKW